MSDEDLFKLCKSAARRVCFQWPNAIDEDDLCQEIMLHFLQRPGVRQRFDNEDAITQKSFLVKVAHQCASDMMVEYDSFSGNYTYDTEVTRRLLEEQAWTVTEARVSTEVMDLREALANLADRNSNYFAVIVNRYKHELIGPDRKKLQRAVIALTEEMNLVGQRRRKDFVEGPGSRKAISNATAAVRVATSYQGEYGDGRH